MLNLKEDGQDYHPTGTTKMLAEEAKVEEAKGEEAKVEEPRMYADYIPCPAFASMYNAGWLNPKLVDEQGKDLPLEEALKATVEKDELEKAIGKSGVGPFLSNILVRSLVANNRNPFPLFRMAQFPDLMHGAGSYVRYSTSSSEEKEGPDCKVTRVGFNAENFDRMIASHDGDKNGCLCMSEVSGVVAGLKPSSPLGKSVSAPLVFGMLMRWMANVEGKCGKCLDIGDLRLLYRGLIFGKNVNIEEMDKLHETSLWQALCGMIKVKVSR